MSKSHQNPKSRIHLTDSDADISKKIRVALTDLIEGVSYDRLARPGVSNLVDIAFYLDAAGASSAAELAKDFEGLSLKAFKERIAKIISQEISPIRERYEQIMAGDGREVADAASMGAAKASASAETLSLIHI